MENIKTTLEIEKLSKELENKINEMNAWGHDIEMYLKIEVEVDEMQEKLYKMLDELNNLNVSKTLATL